MVSKDLPGQTNKVFISKGVFEKGRKMINWQTIEYDLKKFCQKEFLITYKY